MKSRFKVKGMHCVSCAMIIEDEVEEMGDIKDVDCSYKKEILEIESNKEITASKLDEMFEKFGYTFEQA